MELKAKFASASRRPKKSWTQRTYPRKNNPRFAKLESELAELENIIPLDLRKYGKPPEPTVAHPFAQLEWIFDKRKDRMSNESTKNNYQSAKTFFIQHIESSAGPLDQLTSRFRLIFSAFAWSVSIKARTLRNRCAVT